MSKLIQYYKKISLPAKASLWFIFASVLQNGISFLTVPIFTRLLTTEDFGSVNVYQSWLSIITILATLSLWGGVFNNGMIKYEEDKNGFLSSLQGLSTTITIGLLLIFVVFSNFFVSLFGFPFWIIVLMFTQINFSTSLNLWAAKQRFEFHYKKLVMITIFISLANPTLGLILVFLMKNGGTARIVSIAIVQIFIGIIMYIHNLRVGKEFASIRYWKYALSFNIPLIPHYLSLSILNQSDRIMINSIVGADKAGVYSIAYSIGMILLLIIISINSILTPWTYKKIQKKEYYDVNKTSNILLVFLSISILLLISIAPEIMKIMAPPEYGEAIWVIPPIAVSIYFIFLYGLFANVEFYFEENKFIMIASVMAAVLNISLNLICIPLFGYHAAAYTTLISYIAISISHFVFMKKVVQKYNLKNGIYDYKKIFIISILLIILSTLLMLTYNFKLIRFIVVLFLGFIGFLNKSKLAQIIDLIKI